MKTQFEKIYVISLINNKERQEFIKYQMNELGLDFEFIYGIDFYNIKYDRFNKNINYPSLVDYDCSNNIKMYGCAITHYNAVLQAYEFGYNNVLIIEDDTCLIKNKNILSYYLNNIPNYYDFITFTARFTQKDERIKFANLINNFNNKYAQIDNNYMSLCGNGMYGLMNRNTMKLYLDNQRAKFSAPDYIENIFKNSTINRCTSYDAICMDVYNRFKLFERYDSELIERMGITCYNQYNKINDYNDFYIPNNCKNVSTIHNFFKNFE